jgi:hypothetical protein
MEKINVRLIPVRDPVSFEERANELLNEIYSDRSLNLKWKPDQVMIAGRTHYLFWISET